MMLVPALSHQLLLIDIMGGEPVAAADLAVFGRRHDPARLRVLRPDVPNPAPGENRLRARVSRPSAAGTAPLPRCMTATRRRGHGFPPRPVRPQGAAGTARSTCRLTCSM